MIICMIDDTYLKGLSQGEMLLVCCMWCVVIWIYKDENGFWKNLAVALEGYVVCWVWGVVCCPIIVFFATDPDSHFLLATDAHGMTQTK